MNLLKSIGHNILVLVVGFVFALIGRGLDLILGIHWHTSFSAIVVGGILLATGFLLRVWATLYFYEQDMSVIRLVPQKKLITAGPFGYSRNPLYLGGNVFIFLGAVLVLGSPSGIVLTVINVFAVNIMIKREEKQLADGFGEEWATYKQRVRRWL